MIVAKVIDLHAAWEAVWTASVAGIGITIVCSLTVLGATRSADSRRDGRGGTAALYGLLGIAGAVVMLGAVAYAIALITTK